MASMDHNITVANWNDFGAVWQQVGRNTVDRLKRIIRYANERLGLHLRYGGLKASLIESLRKALDDTRSSGSLQRYSILRYAILHPDSLYTSYNYQPATSTSTAPTPAPAQGPERYSSYSPHAQPAPSSSVPPYQRFRAPQPTSATSAAALARYSAMQASMTAPRPVPASSTSFPSPRPVPTPPPPASQPKPKIAPNPIDFRPNPFLTFKCALSSVVTCPRTQTGERKSVSAAFSLSAEQRQLIKAARESDQNPQYQVRVYCCSETYYNVPISSYYQMQPTQPLGPAPVEFPMQSEVRINNIAVSANLRGIKKKEGTVMPPNVGATKNSFGILALDLATSARNTVDLVYINTEKRFFIVVCLVQYHTAEDLLKQIREAPPKSRESVIADIIEANKDEDIVATSAALSLRCPLSFMRLKDPIRSKNCSHIQCFEASTWFAMNEQTPTWNCPQCNKVVRIVDLFIDDFTRSIIATVPEKYDSVIVEPDATWYTEDNKYGTSSRVGQPPADSVKKEDTPDESQRESSSRPVQILDSDDDEHRGAGAQPNGQASNSGRDKQASPRRPPPSKGAVIDLTLSDDEEEPPPAAPRPQPQPEPVPNGNSETPLEDAVTGQKRPRDDDWGTPADEPPSSRPRISDQFVW